MYAEAKPTTFCTKINALTKKGCTNYNVGENIAINCTLDQSVLSDDASSQARELKRGYFSCGQNCC